MGFRKFAFQALKTQENVCQQEMQTAVWNITKQKSSAVLMRYLAREPDDND
jgi:hypothetical protein